MLTFYKKQELWFAILLILIYVIGQSLATSLNAVIGIDFAANAILNIALTLFLLLFLKKNGLMKKYGLSKPTLPASRFLFYIPLVVISSHNLWLGVAMNFSPAALVCYIVYMFCVGIVEEILFRGLLFRAIAKDNVRLAILISSLTFGLGHIVNLLNGVSTSILETACQIVGAVALGFLFVVIVHRGGSLLPCIFSHSCIDVASAFANTSAWTPEMRILLCVIRFALVVVYTVLLLKTLPKPEAGKAPAQP